MSNIPTDSSNTSSSTSHHDLAVMETASDASLCKLSASKLGYFQDNFLNCFVKNPSRRMPIMNRGYYARIQAIEMLLMNFLNNGHDDRKKQVIILGAGMDTMYFRLSLKNQLKNICQKYVEVDFPDITMQKILYYKKYFKQFGPFLGCENSFKQFQQNISSDFTCYSSSNDSKESESAVMYHLVACDLRNVQALEKKFQHIGIDATLPTLFISECVLIYMEAEYSKALIEWTSQRFFKDVSYVLYEQILPEDAFGRVMIENIKARGCELLSIQEYPTIQSQLKRFQDVGYQFVQCWDMKDIYYHYLETKDRLKKEKLEIFDEVEEFHLLLEHYCIVVAHKRPLTEAGEDGQHVSTIDNEEPLMLSHKEEEQVDKEYK